VSRYRLVPRHADPRSLVRVGEEASTELDLEPVWDAVVRLYGQRLHPALALCVMHRGEVVLDRTIGHMELGSDELVTPATRFNLFSASKILTAAVVHGLLERELLSLDEPLVRAMPGLDRHGKSAIRLRHLLQHTAGIPNMPTHLDPAVALGDVSAVLEDLFAVPLLTPPGAAVAYHPISSWVLLGELVRRRTGHDLRHWAHVMFLEPLAFQSLDYGVPADQLHTVARHAYTGLTDVPLMSDIFLRTVGLRPEQAVEVSNSPGFLQAVLPSANVMATPREAARFLQMILQEGILDGTRVLQARTVRRMLDWETPRSLDGTFGFPIRYGLGLMKGARMFSLFGPQTRHAFGHLGFSNVLVYADPEREMSVAFLNTGKPMLAPGMVPWAVLVQRLALRIPRG
jgi:CubicO group peptidase (beta-lactamase class C family)